MRNTPLSLLLFLAQITPAFSIVLSADSTDSSLDEENTSEIYFLDDSDEPVNENDEFEEITPPSTQSIDLSPVTTPSTSTSPHPIDHQRIEKIQTNEEEKQLQEVKKIETTNQQDEPELGIIPITTSSKEDLYPSDDSEEDSEPEEGSCTLPQWGAFGLRHIEGKGIGYNQGYTSLDAFFLVPFSEFNGNYAFFFDARGHVFDDGKLASNLGFGARILRSHLHTIAAYYDYRETNHHHYNQISFNYENLGKRFDWRANGYLPVGSHTSSEYGGLKFHSFHGHSMIISKKKEFAMWGANAEIGKALFSKASFQCYGAMGPYYYGRSNTNAWGGQVRLNTEFNQYIKLECNASYDNIFHGIAQAQLSLVWPLGPKKKDTSNRKLCSESGLIGKLSQRVERNEIIVTHHKESKSTAIDPATGQPYFFWFVNNTSHSAGTYESPFPELLMAQNASSVNDVIYVFPGDGTDTGMQSGIDLKDNQRLFGSSTPHIMDTTEGSVVVPALTQGLPLISSNIVNTPVVKLSSNNEIAGLSLHGIELGIVNNYAILGGPFAGGRVMSNVYVHDCDILTDGFPAMYINNNPDSGDTTIANCNISGGGIGVIIGGNTNATVTISNCAISAYNGEGIQFTTNTNLGHINISDCTVSSVNQDGFLFFNNFSSKSLTISNCSFAGGFGEGMAFRQNQNLGRITISNCSISANLLNGLVFDQNDQTNVLNPVTITNCSIKASSGTYGVSFTNNPNTSSVFRLNLLNNTIENPPPTTAGYFIDNPSSQPAFLLELFSNVGVLSVPNPVTIITP